MNTQHTDTGCLETLRALVVQLEHFGKFVQFAAEPVRRPVAVEPARCDSTVEGINDPLQQALRDLGQP